MPNITKYGRITLDSPLAHRFDFQLRFGETADTWRRFNQACVLGLGMVLRNETAAFDQSWRDVLLPLRVELVRVARAMMNAAGGGLEATGSLGTISNLQQLQEGGLRDMLSSTDTQLTALHGARCKPVGQGRYSPQCYSEHTVHGRVLPIAAIRGCSDSVSKSQCVERGGEMSHEWCGMLCAAMGHRFAGVEGLAGNQCYCGDEIPSWATPVPEEECDVPCSGNRTQACGGDWRITAFVIDCATRIPPHPPALPPSALWEGLEEYSGVERIAVLTPRGRLSTAELDSPHGVTIHAVVLTANESYVSQPVLHLRRMGGLAGVWTRHPMRRVTPKRHTWSIELGVGAVTWREDFEYFITAATHRGGSMAWPAGGAPNAHTVVVAG